MFMGRWIKRSSGYPTWFARAMRPDKVTVEREINEAYETDGEVGYLETHLIHYPFNKGSAYWLTRHNRYSSMEAAVLQKERQQKINFSALVTGNPIERRQNFKLIAYRLPFRPLLTFGYLYIIRRGFLDGYPGFIYSVLRAIYEFFINLKIQEAIHRQRGDSF